MAKTAVKMKIGEVRFSYLHVFEPYAFEEGKTPQYTATVLIPKSNTQLVAQIEASIKQAYDAAVTEKWGGKKPVKYTSPLQDGDEPKQDGEARGPEFQGCYFINAKSNNQPGIVDRNMQPIMSSEEFYSGCYGYISCAFSGWINSGKPGISCYLNNLLKTRDGDPLGGARVNAADDFSGLGLDADDDM